MQINSRTTDMKIEREIASFLDEHLYNNKELFSEYKRTDDLENQIAGSDLILSSADSKLKNIIVDEKVAAKFVNRNLQTFALELSFKDRYGNLMDGWLIDPSKKTEYYLCGWIDMADIPDIGNGNYDYSKISKNNIKKLEWVLVSRKILFNFLKDRGYDKTLLKRQDTLIRQRGYVKTKEFINDITFRYSPKYKEEPINVLLKREKYIELSDMHGIIQII
jgi:hypothetical protein